MITVENLCFSYGARVVLNRLSFSASSGSLLSVLGLNGSGKSTMLKCLNRILKPSTGVVTVNGENSATMSLQQLSTTIAYLPQSPFPMDCTVFEAVLLGRKPHMGWQVSEEDMKETALMIEMAGLRGYDGRNCNSLSGGELQRVAIARTLAQKPKILLLDEPANHLDIRSQIDLLALIRRVTSELGIVNTAVMHDLNMALRFSDRLLMMKEGAGFAQGGLEVMTAENIRELYNIDVVIQQIGGITVVVPCPELEPSVNIP